MLEQSDATGWMGMFCLNLMRIALELAKENRVYEALATKFFQHYVYVAAAMKHMGNRDYQLWDEQDGFFYDVLRYPDGRFHKFRVRSLVGLIPLFAVERLEVKWIEPFTEFRAQLRLVHEEPPRPGRATSSTPSSATARSTHVLTILNQDQLRRMTRADLGPGRVPLRLRHPQPLEGARAAPVRVRRQRRSATSRPRRSSKIKGGNSNWRGPIWFPTCFLLIESLRKLGKAFGDDVRRRGRRPATASRSPSTTWPARSPTG